MKILVACIHYPVASGRYAVAALRRMGHDVRSIGPNTGNQIWGIEVDPKYTWIADLPEKAWEPDLVIVMDSELGIERVGDMPWVCYGVDNHVRDYHLLDGVVDHFFLAHGHGARMGTDNVTWLPCGYDPELCTPGPAWNERPDDLALIGVQYPQRASLLYALLSAGLPLRAQYGLALFEAYRQAYQNAKISVVASAHNDVAMRVWETAAMGCLVLKDANPDDDALDLEDGKNCLIYHTQEQAVDKVRWALSHPDDAQKIAKAGQKWAKPGTWEARLQVILDWAKAQPAPKRGEKAVKDAE
jgi:hypothetical protein